jgi:hypothetical protein
VAENVKPLEQFNFTVVQEPLTGLLRNVESDLRKRIDIIGRIDDLDEQRRVILLMIMLKFAINSYLAVSFLLSDVDQHPRRIPQFVLVVPPINRQLMDLWFSLVYIMDDLGPRALAFDQCGYRELGEEINRMKARYGSDPDWQPWFQDMQDLMTMMEQQVQMTPAQKANPANIPYWLTPFKLAKQPGKSQSFLQFLEQLLYHDTSAEAHLKPGGLFASGSFLLKDIAPEHIKRQLENRTIHQYKFRHLCRTVVALLGIVSEIELFGRFGNHEQLAKVWTLLAGYNADAKDVYEMKYRQLLGS